MTIIGCIHLIVGWISPRGYHPPSS